MLALCMQYGTAYMPLPGPMNNNNNNHHTHANSAADHTVDRDDSALAGRWYYRRSQALAARKPESPTLATVQRHLYTAFYLSCASFQDMAHATLTACSSHLPPRACRRARGWCRDGRGQDGHEAGQAVRLRPG